MSTESVPTLRDDVPDNATDDSMNEKFTVVQFDGDDDPWDPKNFPEWKKWAVLFAVAHGAVIVTCASSLYTACYTQIEDQFEVSSVVAILGLTTFVVGLALGPLLFAPLSEFYGRKPIYIISYLFFIIWQVPTAVAQNIATILVSRFLAGFSGAAFLSVAGGSITDMWIKEEVSWPMVIFTLGPFLGPTIGPVVGGFINQHVSWRWTFYVILIWAGTQFFINLFVPETYGPALLKKKAKYLRNQENTTKYKSPMELDDKSIISAIGHFCTRPFQLLLREPICFLLCLYSSFLLSVLYLFFEAFPLVFKNNHGFELQYIGLSFIGLGIGEVVGGLISRPIVSALTNWFLRHKNRDDELRKPEFRLIPAMLGAILVPIGMFWFAFTGYASVPWIVPILAGIPFGWGVVLVFSSIFNYLVDAYREWAASAMAANTFMRCVMAGGFPLFAVQMYNRLGYDWAGALIAFICLAMAPLPFVFFYWGETLRQKSKFAHTTN